MKDIAISLRVCLVTVLVCAVAYPTLVLGFAALFSTEARHGSLIVRDGVAVGSSLIAQKFERPEYFWPRPSAVDYDASAAGGSNLSPASPLITERAEELIGRFGPAEGELIPADLVLASGAGLDPHVTRAASMFQVSRVAKARSLTPDRVRELVNEHTDSSALSAFGGEPIVNVLELNLALDEETGSGE